MDEEALHVLQVSTADVGGGAEKVAWNLFEAYRRRGHESWLAVGRKRSRDAHVVAIPNDVYRSRWARLWIAMSNVVFPDLVNIRGLSSMRSRVAQCIGQPRRRREIRRGREDFEFPATWRLLDLPPHVPDVLHCHNLHGNYFDLSALSWLSRQVPLILTLHDGWLLSGHCAHSFECDRWKVGCGNCPDLTIYPSIRRDATSFNWRRKRSIYADSRVYVVTPCQWLMNKVNESALAASVVESRVIPNGVDLSVFHPGDPQEARKELGIPSGIKLLLTMANRFRQNEWGDHATLRAALWQVAKHLERNKQRVIVIVLGGHQVQQQVGDMDIRFVPYQDSQSVVARHYQAADVYVHASRADTFPNAVLEALACGIPVVASAVGGIEEQISSYDGPVDGGRKGASTRDATGIVVHSGDAVHLARAITTLLADDRLRKRLGEHAAREASRRFNLERQVDALLGWYRAIIESHRHRPRTDARHRHAHVA